jgi:hypothetical protein
MVFEENIENLCNIEKYNDLIINNIEILSESDKFREYISNSYLLINKYGKIWNNLTFDEVLILYLSFVLFIENNI